MPKLTRDDTLSCSQLPAVMGLSPFSTPNDVLAQLRDGFDKKPRNDETNEAMEWGNRTEYAILQKISEVLGASYFECPKEPFYYNNILGASLDGIAYINEEVEIESSDKVYVMTKTGKIKIKGPGAIEAKNTKAPGSDNPEPYRGPIQLQGQMICSGLRWGAVGVLHQGHDFRLFLYEADANMQEYIIMVAKDVESRVETYARSGEMDWYDISSSADANRVWPRATTEEVVDLSTVEDDIRIILDAKTQIAELEKSINISEARIKEKMASSQSGMTHSYLVSWPMRNYKAQPEKLVPPKEAYSVRQNTLSIKEIK